MTDQTATNKVSKTRTIFWPIFGIEHKKFLPMTFMIALILFIYTILRNMKDTLVVSSTGGSEVITALKLYAVLPSAIISFFIIAKLYNTFSREKVFYIIVTFFIAFFGIFTLILYPNQAFFEPTNSSAWLREVLPQGKFYENFINMYQYWSFSLFYIFSELWGSIVASLLFWQFANSIVKVSEAKRFYAHFYLIANLATALSGVMGQYYSKLGKAMPTEFERYAVTVQYTCWTVVVLGILVLFLYRYLNTVIVNDSRLVSAAEAIPEKKKLKLSMWESLKFIFSSKYLGLIALLVLSYGISINIVEVAWKHEIHMLYPAKNDYNHYMSMYSMINGLATFVVILIGSNVIRVLGWKVGALATPIMLGVTGLLFFYFMIFDETVTPMA
ncbi:MAG TPA: Npt1/Npt2 family nucleotide transporter, partial [Gammaproteobacteria bacterium]|nr:Npt1/Npt2 family nucleotide transporter [Gammaproteobacteria bacterium]